VLKNPKIPVTIILKTNIKIKIYVSVLLYYRHELKGMFFLFSAFLLCIEWRGEYEEDI